MFHHPMILYLNLLPVCFQLIKSGEKKGRGINNCSSLPLALIFFFNLSLRNISQVSSLYLLCLHVFLSSFWRKSSATILKVICLKMIKSSIYSNNCIVIIYQLSLFISFPFQDGLPPYIPHTSQHIITEPTNSFTSLG